MTIPVCVICSQTHRPLQEYRILGQVVGTEETAQDPDGELEQVDIPVDVEIQSVSHPVSGFPECWKVQRK